MRGIPFTYLEDNHIALRTCCKYLYLTEKERIYPIRRPPFHRMMRTFILWLHLPQVDMAIWLYKKEAVRRREMPRRSREAMRTTASKTKTVLFFIHAVLVYGTKTVFLFRSSKVFHG
jgi:hypothetical protein